MLKVGPKNASLIWATMINYQIRSFGLDFETNPSYETTL